MGELYDIAFSAANLPYTILMIVLTVYWCVVLLGLVDIDLFDFDLGGDLDVDPGDFDADVDAAGLGPAILGFLNVGEVPIMFYASIVALSMWVVSVQLNQWIGNESIWVAALLAVPNLMFGLLVAKFATTPFKWMNERPEQETLLVGKVCLVTSSEVTDRFGACQMETGESPIMLTARTRDGEVLHKGEAAVVVERLRKTNTYIVTKYQPQGEVCQT